MGCNEPGDGARHEARGGAGADPSCPIASIFSLGCSTARAGRSKVSPGVRKCSQRVPAASRVVHGLRCVNVVDGDTAAAGLGRAGFSRKCFPIRARAPGRHALRVDKGEDET